MPIDVQKALSAQFEPVVFEYTTKDVILYALGVGAGDPPTEKEELQFCYEGGLKVLPTFGVIPIFSALPQLTKAPGIQINPMMIVHGEQYLEIRKYPIPVRGKLISKQKIGSIYDKGKGALINLEATTETEKGEEIFFNIFSIFVRGEGGFGGERGTSQTYEPPARPADEVVEMKTSPTQALLYRLSGDLNPLHADPNFAKMAGFEKPILHGLCTFGFIGRAIIKKFCNNNPDKIKSLRVRFASHIFPGETIVTEFWKEGDKDLILKAKTKERGNDIITNAIASLY